MMQREKNRILPLPGKQNQKDKQDFFDDAICPAHKANFSKNTQTRADIPKQKKTVHPDA
jgi:hypothetical protein